MKPSELYQKALEASRSSYSLRWNDAPSPSAPGPQMFALTAESVLQLVEYGAYLERERLKTLLLNLEMDAFKRGWGHDNQT